MLTFFERSKVMRLKDAIEQRPESASESDEKAYDYVSVIVSLSPVISFFYSIDQKVTQKIRVLLVTFFSLLALKYLAIIDITVDALALMMGFASALIILLPGLIVKYLINNRKKTLQDALPYFVDLVAVCVQSGMTVESALKYTSLQFTPLDVNLATLITHAGKKAEVSGLEDALGCLYRAIDLLEMRMFCSCLLQSVRYGASLYEALSELAKDMREMQLLQIEEKIGKLSAKMSVPLVIFIMLPIVVLIIAPSLLRIMQNGISS